MSGIENNPFRSLDSHYMAPVAGKKSDEAKMWTIPHRFGNLVHRIGQSMLRSIPTRLLFLLPGAKKLINDYPINNREMLTNLNHNIDYLAHHWKTTPEEMQKRGEQLSRIKACINQMRNCTSKREDLTILAQLESVVTLPPLLAPFEELNSPEENCRSMEFRADLKDTRLTYLGLANRVSIIKK